MHKYQHVESSECRKSRLSRWGYELDVVAAALHSSVANLKSDGEGETVNIAGSFSCHWKADQRTEAMT